MFVCLGQISINNIARSIRAYQMTDYQTTTLATAALDGDFTTISCTTTSNPRPWWAVELAVPAAVIGVNVTNDRNTNFRNYRTFIFLRSVHIYI